MADRDDVRRGYDELAATYAEQRSGDGPATEVLESFLPSVPEGGRVLDAGCGQGTPVLRRLAERGPAVGVDISRESLRLARERVPAAATVQGDLTALSLATDAVDAVVASWSLIHVPLADHPATIEEFARVLRPGGRALVCEGTVEWVGATDDWLGDGVGMEWAIAGRDATREQLFEAGFAVEAEWGVPERIAGDDENGDDHGATDVDWPLRIDGESTPDTVDWVFFEATLDRE